MLKILGSMFGEEGSAAAGMDTAIRRLVSSSFNIHRLLPPLLLDANDNPDFVTRSFVGSKRKSVHLCEL